MRQVIGRLRILASTLLLSVYFPGFTSGKAGSTNEDLWDYWSKFLRPRRSLQLRWLLCKCRTFAVQNCGDYCHFFPRNAFHSAA